MRIIQRSIQRDGASDREEHSDYSDGEDDSNAEFLDDGDFKVPEKVDWDDHYCYY